MLSAGRLLFGAFPNGQLGSETQTMEQLQAGALDIAKGSSAPISNSVSVCKVFSLPYLFRDGFGAAIDYLLVAIEYGIAHLDGTLS